MRKTTLGGLYMLRKCPSLEQAVLISQAGAQKYRVQPVQVHKAHNAKSMPVPNWTVLSIPYLYNVGVCFVDL